MSKCVFHWVRKVAWVDICETCTLLGKYSQRPRFGKDYFKHALCSCVYMSFYGCVDKFWFATIIVIRYLPFEDIFDTPHTFRVLFEGEDLVLGLKLELRVGLE